jgi:hypothetical protein
VTLSYNSEPAISFIAANRGETVVTNILSLNLWGFLLSWACSRIGRSFNALVSMCVSRNVIEGWNASHAYLFDSFNSLESKLYSSFIWG